MAPGSLPIVNDMGGFHMALVSSSELVRLKATCFCDAIPGPFYMPQIVGDKAASLNQREELLVPIQISEPLQGAFYRLLWICTYSGLRPFSRDSPAAEVKGHGGIDCIDFWS